MHFAMFLKLLWRKPITQAKTCKNPIKHNKTNNPVPKFGTGLFYQKMKKRAVAVMIPLAANCGQITAICQKFITSCFGLTTAVVGLIIKMCNFLHILPKSLDHRFFNL